MPVKSSAMASSMKTVISNLSGKRRALSTAVNMLAVAELYSFTTLSNLLRIAATTNPPILLKVRPSTRNNWTLGEMELRLWRMRRGLKSGEETRWTRLATSSPYR